MKPTRRTLSHSNAAGLVRHEATPFVQACESFEGARDTLLQLVSSMCFVRVVSLQAQSSKFMGEAIEVPIGHGFSSGPFGSHHHGAPNGPPVKTVFFDKFGRSRGPLKLGPVTLVQAPMGPDHPTSVPSVGELLVGTAMENTREKSPLKYVLRGWSSNAKPLWELLRMVRFGTRMTEPKCRDLLIQLPCSMSLCPEGLRKYRDELYVMARIVLFGNLRPLQVLAQIEGPDFVECKEKPSEIEIQAARQLKLGCIAMDFVDLCTLKLNCPSIQEKFLEGLNILNPQYRESERPKTPPAYESMSYDQQAHQGASHSVYENPYNLGMSMMTTSSSHYGTSGYETTTYGGSSTVAPNASSSTLPPGSAYAQMYSNVGHLSTTTTTVPMYTPASPPPNSLYQDVHTPSETVPAAAPPVAHAPVTYYMPTSPPYRPTTPPYAQQDANPHAQRAPSPSFKLDDDF